MSNNTRIAKNTLALYFRQILIMLVSLYTVRVVLETLGAEDYGIYNVAAGVVTMFGFLNSSMLTAAQRYFAFETGRGDFEHLKKTFSMTLVIYLLAAAVILLLAETLGLWFVSNKLLIPAARKRAAIWVYEFSTLSFISTALTMPYMAMIITREEMNIYAYISIIEALLKLGTVFILHTVSWDKLTVYGILLLSVALINMIVYRTICLKKYPECGFSFYWNKDLFRAITGYIGWNMFGASGGIFKNQVLNIILNQFFSPVVIAARSIAAMVTAAASSFSANFNIAIRPQLIKSYAAGQKELMISLLFRGSKGTYLLIYLIILPLVLEMPVILGIWLKNPPEYTALFVRLTLLDVLIDSISHPVMTAAQATGKIKLFQTIDGGILFLNLPISWIVLAAGSPPYSVMIVSIGITILVVIARVLIADRLVGFSTIRFLGMVVLPSVVVSIVSAVPPLLLFGILKQGLRQLFFVTLVSIISVGVCGFYLGINREERKKIRNITTQWILRRKI